MNRNKTLSALFALVLTACGGDDTSSSSNNSSSAGTGGDGGGAGAGGAGVVADARAPDSGGSATGMSPPAEFIPAPTGTCPGFVEGDGCTRDDTSLICTFTPSGIPARPVRVWLADTAFGVPSPVVFFFHGLTRNAADAVLPAAGLGPDVVQAIVDANGLVVSMEKDQSLAMGDFPWLSGVSPGPEDDFLVMDEVVACAMEKVTIDLSHIHVTGMSAGGLQTGATVARRSGYVASATTFSGGQPAVHVDQYPDNPLPVMIVYGGANDMVILNFMDQSLSMQTKLEADGHFTFICNHEMGHIVDPPAATAAWQFFQDHPYGEPSPYANGLPASMPAYCSL